jgi:cysteinyl-tRNA synthetase
MHACYKQHASVTQYVTSIVLQLVVRRYMIVTSQYRTSLNFAPEALAGAKSALKRLDKFKQQIVSGQFFLHFPRTICALSSSLENVLDFTVVIFLIQRYC